MAKRDEVHQALVADRVWRALHALPRDETGRPPGHTQFAAARGFNKSAMSRLLREERMPGPKFMGALSKALGVSLDYLVLGTGPEPQLTGPMPSRREVLRLDPLTQDTDVSREKAADFDGLVADLEQHRREDDPPDERATVFALARLVGAFDEADFAAVKRHAHREWAPGDTPGPAYWWRALEEARRKRLEREAALEVLRAQGVAAPVGSGQAAAPAPSEAELERPIERRRRR